MPVQFEIDPDNVRNPDRLGQFFRKSSLPVSQWAGCTVFLFPELERDDLPIFLDDRVREFYRRMCRSVPFLLYFLDPGPWHGAMLSVLCAFARDDQITQHDGEVTVDPDDTLRDQFARLVADAAVYGSRLGDDGRAFIDELGLPDDFRARALEMCEPRLPAVPPPGGLRS